MAEPLRVLCLSPDPAIAAGVTAMLASLPDFAVASRTAGYDEGLRELREPDLAIVVLEEDPGGGLRVIDAVRRASRGTYIVAVSLEDDAAAIVQTMRAGAAEHLALPLSQQDLFKICIKVAELRRSGGPHEAHGGELWVAYGPKGGVGVTTVVVNLGVALRAAQRDVALVDLDVYAGDAAFFLNVKPTYTLRDVATNFQRLDSVLLQGAMGRHPSGLLILAAPAAGRGEPPLELSGEQALRILELVTGMHEVTLVDTPGIPSEATRAVLAVADRILLVTDLTVPALRGCVRTIDWLVGEGVETARVDLVVNRYGSGSEEISPTEASRTLNLPVRALLPRDDATALAAANAGRPLAEVREGTALQRAIAGLVDRTPTPAEPRRPRVGGLLRLFSGSGA